MNLATKTKIFSGLQMSRDTLILLDAPDAEMRQNKLKAVNNLDLIMSIIANEQVTEDENGKHT